jgi:peptidyl-tRNA hydrolase
MASELKQVILVRRDLKLKRASAAALVAKVSAEFLFENDESDVDDKLEVNLSPHEVSWLRSGSTRIVLGVSSESTLRNLLFRAEVLGIQSYALEGPIPESLDKDGVSEIICAALGPDESDKIDEITGNLKLL